MDCAGRSLRRDRHGLRHRLRGRSDDRGGLSGLSGSVGLGVLFGLNIPACATPLLIVLFGAAAVGGVSFARGFTSLALFGLALSLPLIVAVLVPSARRALDWIAGLSQRAPLWTGVVLIGLGLWSIGFGLFASSPKLG